MSPVAFFNWPAATMYSANRAGLLGFTKALKQDLHGTHVHELGREIDRKLKVRFYI